jgi:hypothetical protein
MNFGTYKSRYFGRDETPLDPLDISSLPSFSDESVVNDAKSKIVEPDHAKEQASQPVYDDSNVVSENGESRVTGTAGSNRNCLIDCQICGRQVRFLESHLVKCHQVSSDLYRNLFVNNQGNCSQTRTENGGPELDSSLEHCETDMSNDTKDEDTSTVVTENFEEKCRFVCGICQEVVNSLRFHVKRRHRVSFTEYKELHPHVQYQHKSHHR